MADLYYDKVALLLPMNGTDGGSTFTDWSPTPKTVTRYGDAHTETDQSKFYGSSGAFDGTGDYLDAASNADFAMSADFTIEFWVYTNTDVGIWARVLENEVFSSAGGWHVSYNGEDQSGSRRLGFQLSKSGGGGARIDSDAAIATGQWVHIAFSRSGSTIAMFVNGTKQAATITDATAFTSQKLRISSALGTPGNYFKGYLQDIRFTKGVARYTESLTPPGKLIGAISGTVYDANGDPAARKIVAWPRVIHPPTTARTYTTTSSAVDGSYTLGPMPDAEYARIVLADETTLVNDIVDRVFPG